jgi:pilus assembly protein CpaE
MPNILTIDYDPTYPKMVSHALEPLGYHVDSAKNGFLGLRMAKEIKPDLVIVDVMMPDMDGYEVTRQLRREPGFAHTPILVLTSQSDLQSKIASFEAGADDHVIKPFAPEELVVRVGALLRRSEAIKLALLNAGPTLQETARVIAVHSLRGGIGTSSLAVNLAIALRSLWECPTLLIDLVLMAGQVSLMLNGPLKRTWADIAGFNPKELDSDVIRSITTQHESGLYYISAPTYPTEAEMFTGGHLASALNLVRFSYNYIVADLPHDFSEITLHAIDAADLILLIMAPEMSSIRAAVVALDTYKKLNFGRDKVKLIMNTTFLHQGIVKEKIENALSYPITMTIPYLPEKFINAINKGQPLLSTQPNDTVSGLIEDFAFHISQERHRNNRPEEPTDSWKRVYKRFMQRKKKS